MLTENCVHVFGVEQKGQELRFVSAGTAATFVVPSDDKDEFRGWMSIVTARHNLMKPDRKTYYDLVAIKMRPIADTNRACFILAPLITTPKKNFWESPTGLDLAVLPFPPELVQSAAFASFKESNILTPEIAEQYGVGPGLLTYSACHQPGYIMDLDLMLPVAEPIVRIGHLSRLGWQKLPNGKRLTRPHVLDAHTSPGNSGATVVLNVIQEDQKVRRSYLLGVIQGYLEEEGSYETYEAPVKVPTGGITLTASDNSTNTVAMAVKTKANPDLTNVIPVHELVGLRNRPEWRNVLKPMMMIREKYRVSKGPVIE